MVVSQFYAEKMFASFENARGQRLQAEKLLHDAKEQVALRERRIENLVVKAPREGTIFSIETIPEETLKEHLDTLPRWSRTPLDNHNLGCYLEVGIPVCTIGDPHKKEAVLIIDQSEIEFVRIRDKVRIKLDAYAEETYEGRIEEIARRELDDSPRQLSQLAGGELATKAEESGRIRPLSASYQARVYLDDPDRAFRPGFIGRAKIECRSRTLAQIVWRYLTDTFHFRL